jgi:hypothetical protein
MPKYVVKRPLYHAGRDYQAGQEIELDSAALADALLKNLVIEPVASRAKRKSDAES